MCFCLSAISRVRSGCGRQHKLQIAHSDRAALDHLQAGFVENGNHVCECDVAMTVMKVMEKAFVVACARSEVNGQHPSARLQNPTHLDGEFLARFRRQMMK